MIAAVEEWNAANPNSEPREAILLPKHTLKYAVLALLSAAVDKLTGQKKEKVEVL
jgi:hypothetical protein